MFCVGPDTRCQHADRTECNQLIRWGVKCRFSSTGKLDELLPTSVCSPLCRMDLSGYIHVECDNPSCRVCTDCKPSPPAVRLPPPVPPPDPSPPPPTAMLVTSPPPSYRPQPRLPPRPPCPPPPPPPAPDPPNFELWLFEQGQAAQATSRVASLGRAQPVAAGPELPEDCAVTPCSIPPSPQPPSGAQWSQHISTPLSVVVVMAVALVAVGGTWWSRRGPEADPAGPTDGGAEGTSPARRAAGMPLVPYNDRPKSKTSEGPHSPKGKPRQPRQGKQSRYSSLATVDEP